MAPMIQQFNVVVTKIVVRKDSFMFIEHSFNSLWPSQIAAFAFGLGLQTRLIEISFLIKYFV